MLLLICILFMTLYDGRGDTVAKSKCSDIVVTDVVDRIRGILGCGVIGVWTFWFACSQFWTSFTIICTSHPHFVNGRFNLTWKVTYPGYSRSSFSQLTINNNRSSRAVCPDHDFHETSVPSVSPIYWLKLSVEFAYSDIL